MSLRRTREGLVTLTAGARESVRYTLDGSEPGETSAAYVGPIPLPRGGVLKARAFAGKTSGDTVTRVFGLAKAKWKIAGTSCDNDGKASAVIDDDVKTLWHTHTEAGRQPQPQWVAVDLGEPVRIGAFTLTPRADGVSHGVPDRYRFEVSADGAAWRPAAEGELSNIRANPVEQTVKLAAPETARFFRFTGLRCLDGDQIAVAELGVLAAP